VLNASLYPKTGGYKGIDNLAYYRELTQRIVKLPGVVSASISESVPPTNFANKVPVVAEPSAPGQSTFEADLEMFAPGVLQTLGMKLEQGRDFSWADDERAPRVAMVSESLAKHLFPAGDAVGRNITVGPENFPLPQRTLRVIGVVSAASFWNLRERYSPELYVPALQS
jgi:putative ABC transport system permease protein